jgi:hypothetical protein
VSYSWNSKFIISLLTGGWRKLHNEELRNLYSSPSIIRMIKSWRTRCAVYVARMGEKRNVYRILVGKPHWHDDVPVGCQVELHTYCILGVPAGKNPKDSNPTSVEAMHCVPLYLSVRHDRCYLQYLTQHGCNVPKHTHACTTFVIWLPVLLFI